MQKKKINTILIVAVALIWAVVLYKFAAPYFTTTDSVITADALVPPKKTIIRKKDTFNLVLPQRDPFLGKVSREVKKSKVVPTKTRKPATTRKAVATSWPKIQYLGYVKSNSSTTKLGLLRIDGVLKRVRPGAVVRDVRIKKIEDQQIILQFGKETKVFAK